MTKEQDDYIKNWLYRANEDIAVIDNLFKTDPEIYASTICFHAQQAVEKFLKAFLVYHNIDFPRTHDLDFLILECKKVDPTDFNIDLYSLSDFGVTIRYPDDFYVPDHSRLFLWTVTSKGPRELSPGQLFQWMPGFGGRSEQSSDSVSFLHPLIIMDEIFS